MGIFGNFVMMEMLYQYIWKHSLLGRRLATVDGREVEVVYPGRHNLDSGPDFFGARLRIGGREWCGNVEVHTRASDWHRHGHGDDPAYRNVILHVVGESDAEIADGRGGVIPQVRAGFPDSFVHLYGRLAAKISEVECEDWLGMLAPLTVSDWLSTLAVERMQRKSQRILDTCAALDHDWEWACFAALARAMGTGLNSDPFEMLARSVPPRILARHSDDCIQLEALLFGQAGLLDMSAHIFDAYFQRLCSEYAFLARKYSLRPLPADIWKRSRTRPQNMPERRIAILAGATHGGFSLLSRVLDKCADTSALRSLFDWEASEYWRSHFSFDVEAARLPARLSDATVDLLLINFAAPLVYAYGASRGNPDLADRGLDIWYGLRAENNRYTRRWQAAGIPCASAADSQALIQLRLEYCDRNRCLDCRFGHALLRSHALPRSQMVEI